MRQIVVIASLAALLALGVVAAPALAGKLTMDRALEVSVEKIENDRCGDPCYSALAHDCERKFPKTIVCKGKTHGVRQGSERFCRGEIRVKQDDGKVWPKLREWSCRAA